MGLGKVTREVFRRSVEPFIPLDRKLELDGATVALTDHTVISHSPSIGVPLDALGFFAFHYAACNVATKFARPTHMITGIYLPLKTLEEDLRIIVKNLGDEARRYDVKIVAGQTATYSGLEIPFVSTTCLGESLRKPAKPREGDVALLVGDVGAEAVWLNALADGVRDSRWRSYTGLDVLLALAETPGVKLLHDVSEGGVKGALLEVASSVKVRLDFSSSDVPLADGCGNLKQDPLSAPTYGTVIAFVDPEYIEQVKAVCTSLKKPATRLGVLQKGSGLWVDGEKITERKRGDVDEIYGAFPRG